MKILYLLLIFTAKTFSQNAYCSYEDIVGDWILYETERNESTDIECYNVDEADFIHETKVSLSYPDVVEDEFGNQGTWTMIIDAGFEIRINDRSHFAYFYGNFDKYGKTKSYCGFTETGWSRDITIRNWACFEADKIEQPETRINYRPKFIDENIIINEEYVKNLNSRQKSWKAKFYPKFANMTVAELHRRFVGIRSHKVNSKTKPASHKSKLISSFLPESFDWRNVDGVNYVSPVRDQRNCRSCYAFAVTAALEARVRILTKNNEQPIFSPQDIIDCSELNDGCEGGYPFLTGRYAKDYGVVLEECHPYTALDAEECTTNASCPLHYSASYNYVGGYYGASNEEEMLNALVKNGPMVVGFMVTQDLMFYASGIYEYEGSNLLSDTEFNPYVRVNHAVLLVGYGVYKDTGEKFWILKNSWGKHWGEDGYLKLIRGTNNCGVESCASEFEPIPN